MQKQQWKKRVEVFRFIYSVLMADYTKDQIVRESFENYEFDEKQLLVIEYFAENKDEIITKISDNLSETWEWNRIPLVVSSIIIAAYCERKAINIDKPIVIDQAVINAKKYGDKNSYKFVNAILDKILI